MAQVTRAEHLLSGLRSGRALLLLGQRHTQGLSDILSRDVGALLDSSGTTSLKERLLQAEEEQFEGLLKAFTAHQPSDDLLAIARNPWSMILLSAVDPIAFQALQQAGGTGRRLRVLYAGEFGTVGRSQPANPTVIRLFGAVDEVDARRRPPLNEADYLSRQAFQVAGVLRELPRLIGPKGILVCAGIGGDDWLTLQSLGLACMGLPPDSVHWFPAAEEPADISELQRLLKDQLVSWDAPLASTLDDLSSSQEASLLEEARSALFQPAARTISIKGVNGEQTQLRLTPEDLRTLSRFASVLYDDLDVPYSFAGRDERRQAFREFLHSIQPIPDWRGVASEFLFEREVTATATNDIDHALRNLGSIHATDSTGGTRGGPRVRTSRLPYVVEGSPASGKTRLLHSLAVELRRKGHPVVYALPGSGRVYFEQLARACAVLEGKGAHAVALIVDGLDVYEYSSLSEFLASVGRNVLVVGSRSRLESASSLGPERNDSEAKEKLPTEAEPAFKRIELKSTLTDEERSRFDTFLAANGFEDLRIPASQLHDRYFLLFLYRLLPDARGNIMLSVTEELERLLSALDAITADSERHSSQWDQQFEKLREKLFPELGTTDVPSESPFAHDPSARQAATVALFCSQIEEPISIDLLIRGVGGALLREYQQFSAAVAKTALLQEIELDAQGTIGLIAEHPFLAKIALKPSVPDPAEQLRVLEPIVRAVHWNASDFPGENPDQDYMLDVFKAIGPRGKAAEDFQSEAALSTITDLLREVREVYGASIPRLMLLEANTLRILAGRDESNLANPIRKYEEAIRILQEAEGILANRRPTPARNYELANITTTLAAVYGYLITTTLRQYESASEPEQVGIRTKVLEYLAEVDAYTLRSRSLGTTSFHPLDVDFWAHRDTLARLPEITDIEKTQMLARLETILEAASEEPLDTKQQDRFKGRVVELAELREDHDLSEALAQEMIDGGNYSGICLLVRNRVFDPLTRQAVSSAAARAGLEQLEKLAPGVLASPEATALMHRLWMSAFLNSWELNGEEPTLAACDRETWTRWRRVLEARLAFPESRSNPYVNFCLAWSLLQVDEPAKAVRILREIEPLTTGNRRRVGALAVICDQNGEPIEFTGLVRRKDAGGTIVYISRLMTEIFLSRVLETQHHPGVQVGDELRFALGVNYRSLTPWYPPPKRKVTLAASG